MRWIETLDEIDDSFGSEAVVWRLGLTDAERFAAGVRSNDEDLADAALAKRDGGAPRLLRRRLLRAMAARAMDVHPDRVRLERLANGAVRVASPWPAYISAAGRSSHMILALSRTPVGVDLEDAAPSFPPPYDALAPQERVWIDQRPAGERALAFLKLWTIKEAYGKALDRGLALAPDRIEAVREQGRWLVRSSGEACGFAEVVADRAVVTAAVTLDDATVATGREACRVPPTATGRQTCV